MCLPTEQPPARARTSRNRHADLALIAVAGSGGHDRSPRRPGIGSPPCRLTSASPRPRQRRSSYVNILRGGRPRCDGSVAKKLSTSASALKEVASCRALQATWARYEDIRIEGGRWPTTTARDHDTVGIDAMPTCRPKSASDPVWPEYRHRGSRERLTRARTAPSQAGVAGCASSTVTDHPAKSAPTRRQSKQLDVGAIRRVRAPRARCAAVHHH